MKDPLARVEIGRCQGLRFCSICVCAGPSWSKPCTREVVGRLTDLKLLIGNLALGTPAAWAILATILFA